MASAEFVLEHPDYALVENGCLGWYNGDAEQDNRAISEEIDKMAQRVRIAKLTEAQLEKIRALETDLGTWVVAVEPEFRLAELTEEQLGKLKAAESELGVILLAYERS